MPIRSATWIAAMCAVTVIIIVIIIAQPIIAERWYLRVLQKGDPEESRAALEYLVAIRSRTFAKQCIKYLSEPNRGKRLVASHALGDMKWIESIPSLIAAMKEDHKRGDVASFHVGRAKHYQRALISIGRPSVAPLLGALEGEEDINNENVVFVSAIVATIRSIVFGESSDNLLVAVGKNEVIALLQALENDSDIAIQKIATELLRSTK